MPNTIHIEEFVSSQKPDKETENKNKNKFVVPYYGGISEQRGIQHLIWAIPSLTDDITNLKVAIVGNGSYLNELKNLRRHSASQSMLTLKAGNYSQNFLLI